MTSFLRAFSFSQISSFLAALKLRGNIRLPIDVYTETWTATCLFVLQCQLFLGRNRFFHVDVAWHDGTCTCQVHVPSLPLLPPFVLGMLYLLDGHVP